MNSEHIGSFPWPAILGAVCLLGAPLLLGILARDVLRAKRIKTLARPANQNHIRRRIKDGIRRRWVSPSTRAPRAACN